MLGTTIKVLRRYVYALFWSLYVLVCLYIERVIINTFTIGSVLTELCYDPLCQNACLSTLLRKHFFLYKRIWITKELSVFKTIIKTSEDHYCLLWHFVSRSADTTNFNNIHLILCRRALPGKSNVVQVNSE